MLLNWRKSRRPVRRRWRRATKSVTPSRECQKPARGCEPTSFVLALPTATSIRHSRAEHHPQRENHCYIGLGAVIQQAPAIDQPPFAACHRRASACARRLTAALRARRAAAPPLSANSGWRRAQAARSRPRLEHDRLTRANCRRRSLPTGKPPSVSAGSASRIFAFSFA